MNKKVAISSLLVTSFLLGMVSVSAQVATDIPTPTLYAEPITSMPVVKEVSVPPVYRASPLSSSPLSVPGNSGVRVGVKKDIACLDLQSTTLRLRSSDTATSKDVANLQSFLASQSLLTSSPTGFLGANTVKAIKQFQRNNGLSQTGAVGPATRGKIRELTCGMVIGAEENPGIRIGEPSPDTSSTLPSKGNPVVAPGARPIACTMEARLCSNGKMMSRFPSSCEWDVTSCDATTSPKGMPVPLPAEQAGGVMNPNGGIPVPPTPSMGKGTAIVGKPPVASVPSACLTMDVRFCPNGAMMARNPVTCEWLASSCPTSSAPASNVTSKADLPASPSVVLQQPPRP